MSRPRYRADDPTARDRITQAFWQLLAEDPYPKLTVLGVVRAAGLNKNTFYYHYDGIDDMARTIVADTFHPEALQQLLSRLDTGGGDVLDPRLEQSFNRLCLIASQHSSSALQEMLKDALRATWSRMLNFDPEELGFEDRLALEFVVGGVTALFAHRANHNQNFTFTDAITTSLRQHVQTILATLAVGKREA